MPLLHAAAPGLPFRAQLRPLWQSLRGRAELHGGHLSRRDHLRDG
jgi:hypothetical protein